MVVVYKWGGIAFDDYSLAKMLTLPSNAKDDVPITFHDEAGEDYVVPAGHVFIAGVMIYQINHASYMGRAGESDTADGAITKEVLQVSRGDVLIHRDDVMGVFSAGKYVTGESNHTTYELQTGATLYGVEVTA